MSYFLCLYVRYISKYEIIWENHKESADLSDLSSKFKHLLNWFKH